MNHRIKRLLTLGDLARKKRVEFFTTTDRIYNDHLSISILNLTWIKTIQATLSKHPIILVTGALCLGVFGERLGTKLMKYFKISLVPLKKELSRLTELTAERTMSHLITALLEQIFEPIVPRSVANTHKDQLRELKKDSFTVIN
jgi:hypothetical protein